MLLALTALLLTLVFLAILGMFFGGGAPPDDTVDEDNKVIPGKEEQYMKFAKREKTKRIVGYIVTFLVICFCLFYVNLLAAVLGEKASRIWFFTFFVGFLDDFLVVQPLKCLLYYLCTQQTFLRILFDICSGTLSQGGSIQIASGV